MCSRLDGTEEMPQQVFGMVFQVSFLRVVCHLLLASALLEATPLMDAKNREERHINIGSDRAHHFLTNSRPKRNPDPKWYRANPDFQSYYRFYNSIGHTEGLYEIDKIRMLYQMMRSYELVYGPDASSYQNVLGVQTTTAPSPTTTLPPTTPAPIPDPLEKAEKIYLCHLKDPLCKPKIVYLPTGAVPVLCDPRHNPACAPKSEEELKTAAPPPNAPAAPNAPKRSADPPPPVVTIKGMEYDCDPFWDPDCLIDHPPRPILEKPAPVGPAEETEGEEKAKEVEESIPAADTQQSPYPHFDPYDFKRDLYDPFLYANPAPEE